MFTNVIEKEIRQGMSAMRTAERRAPRTSTGLLSNQSLITAEDSYAVKRQNYTKIKTLYVMAISVSVGTGYEPK